jgi:hypothetical protein
MENEEKTLALIETLDNYNFIITDKRLFVIKKDRSKIENAATALAYGAPFGVAFGGLIAYREYQQRKEELKGISILFDEIHFIALNKKKHGGEANLKSKNFWRFLKLDEEQFAKLTQLLPTIPQLKEKVTINQ